MVSDKVDFLAGTVWAGCPILRIDHAWNADRNGASLLANFSGVGFLDWLDGRDNQKAVIFAGTVSR
jgi:hypothetical protein